MITVEPCDFIHSCFECPATSISESNNYYFPSDIYFPILFTIGFLELPKIHDSGIYCTLIYCH